MSAFLSAAALAERAERAGISVPEMCRRAGVAPSTFYRWRSGQTTPRMVIYERLVAAVGAPPRRRTMAAQRPSN